MSTTNGRGSGRRQRRQLNPRQRQGVLLVTVAGLALIGVFVLIANYVSSVSKQVGPKIQVLELRTQVAANEALSSSMLTEKTLPAKWAPRNVLTSPAQVGGLVAGVSLPPGTMLQQGDLVQPPSLAPGQVEMAIYVDPETGDAGHVTPGATVDVMAAYSGSAAGSSSKKSSTQMVVSGIKVLSVGTATSGSGGSSGAQTEVQSQFVPITFALTPKQAEKLGYAEAFSSSQQVRLLLVAPGTTGPTKVSPFALGK